MADPDIFKAEFGSIPRLQVVVDYRPTRIAHRGRVVTIDDCGERERVAVTLVDPDYSELERIYHAVHPPSTQTFWPVM